MNFDQLVSVVKLGKISDSSGYFSYKQILELPQRLDTLKEFFLIFKDNRVRFVDVEFSADKILILDETVRKDAMSSEGGLRLALSEMDINSLRINNDQIPVADMKVVFEERIIGDLIDVFNNKAHEVLVVELLDGKEIMIPNVDHFVTGSTANEIYVRNIEDLLKL